MVNTQLSFKTIILDYAQNQVPSTLKTLLILEQNYVLLNIMFVSSPTHFMSDKSFFFKAVDQFKESKAQTSRGSLTVQVTAMAPGCRVTE